MVKQLSKSYDPKVIEDKWYRTWEEKGYFKPTRNTQKEMFSVVMPPPNVTGRLHMGHALDDTMQDILIRYKRLRGYNTLWVPGTDHAGIATQAKVEELLRNQGIKKDVIGRERFVDKCWAWKNEYGNSITEQIRKLGASCDWSMERFTMDDGCSHAVNEAFVQLYEKDLIYQGNYIINWCPHCQTTISDIEVNHEENNGKLYYLHYFSEDNTSGVTIATTRPETIFGDVAVAVHPDDERYKSLVGKYVILPFLNKKIPVISDEYVEMDFGTGVVKITPAHDANDFEMGLRHNLDHSIAIDEFGIMTSLAGQFEGLERFDCRMKVVELLKSTNHFVKEEDYTNSVGHCYRCDTVIEPRVSKQWFIRMEPLAKPALEVVKKGDIKFVPERFTKNYISWLENIRDWCISRQLWWGHRIPVWYCQDCNEVICSREIPISCPTCNSNNLQQDEDVLDTWFSSGLWPFEVFGWPENTSDLNVFYPTSVLVTGRDIIFFWVARMIFDALEFTKEIPFKTVLIHGLVLDDQGRKMSKSLGNGIDPLEEINAYGADALRMTLVTGTTPGNDNRYRQEKIEATRNFTNKIWNAARFVLMNLTEEDYSTGKIELNSTHLHDQWIKSRFARTAIDMQITLDRFEFGEASKIITDFLWDEFCDWYIELSKNRLYGNEGKTAQIQARNTAAWILRETCILLHPIMPFITEEIWQSLPHTEESIMLSEWPSNVSCFIDEKSESEMNKFMEIVKTIRALRISLGIPTGKKTGVYINAHDVNDYNNFVFNQQYIEKLTFASSVSIEENLTTIPKDAISNVVFGNQVYLLRSDFINIDEEIQRLRSEIDKYQKEIERLEKKLNNKGFIAKAPKEVIDKEIIKLDQYKIDKQTVALRLTDILES